MISTIFKQFTKKSQSLSGLQSLRVQNFSAEATFRAKDLVINRTKTPKPQPKHDETLKFGQNSTDHMLEIYWDVKTGWEKPVINPYHKLEIDPFNSTLHYAIECFEGQKAYVDANGKTRLFRPDKNAERLRSSFERISLPTFDPNELIGCIKELVRLDKSWIPKKNGFSLYMRPTGISMTDTLGIRAPDKALLFVVMSPVGPYYPTGFAPIKLYAERHAARAFPGSAGHYKVGSNYGPTIKISKEAEKKGFNQILWLTGDLITEVGTSNIFFLWINEKGEKELVTPPLEGLILPGITRDSILALTRQQNKFKVSERNITVQELVKAIKEKRVLESFGSGTAAVCSPIKSIFIDGVDYQIPIDEKIGAGHLSKELCDTLYAIQYGKVNHPWSVVID